MKFSSNLTLYAVLSLSQRVASFIMFPLLTRAVTPADYGFLVISNNVLAVSSGICLLGLDIALITRLSESKRQEDASQIIYSLLLARIVLFAIQALAIFCIAWLYANESLLFYLLMISAVQAIVAAALSHFSQTLQAFQKHNDRFKVEMIFLVVQFAVTVGLLYATRMGVLVVPVAGLLASFVALIFAALAVWPYFRADFDIETIKSAVGFSAPLVISSLALAFSFNGTPIAIGAEVGPEAAAIYGAALSVAGLVSITSFAFGQFWLPTVHRIYRSEKAPIVLREVQKLYAVLQLVQALVLALVASQVIKILTPAPYHDAYKYVPVLLVYYLIQEIIGLFSIGLGIASRYSDRAKAGLLAAIAFLIVVYPLLRLFSVMGGCLALAIAQAVFSAVCMIRSQHYYRVQYDWSYVGGVFLVYIAAVTAFWRLDLFNASIPAMALICVVMLCAAAGYLLLNRSHIEMVLKVFNDPDRIDGSVDVAGAK